jgi:DNA-binding transcriptional LysR family regulator
MEIRMLRTFLVVVETGTLVQASKRLHCVQSNITSRIKALEEELGVDLFVRSRRGMELTAAGALFESHARAVVDAEASAIAAVENFSNSVKILRIGSMESTLAVRLPEFIAAFRAIHPDVRISVKSGPTDDLVRQVLGNKIDIAFIGGQFKHSNLEGRTAFSEEMVLVTDKNTAGPGQTCGSPVIVFRPGCSYRSYSHDWMKKSGLAPNDFFELGTLDGILGCVAAGIGVTLLPLSVVNTSRHRDLLKVHTLTERSRFIDTIAIRNSSGPVNQAIDSFIDFVCG